MAGRLPEPRRRNRTRVLWPPAPRVCDGVFDQSGIIRCVSIEQMFNAAQVLADQALPRDNRIAIVTNAGGPGVMATDAAVSRGLRLAEFSQETTAKLKKALPAAANIKNPIDVIGDAREDRYAAGVGGGSQRRPR